MSTLFKIAWRNVWRHGKRTALTIITMAFGLGIFMWMDSIMKGMDRMGLEAIVEYTDSSLRLTSREYADELRGAPLDYGIEAELPALRRFLASYKGVEAISVRTRFTGELSNGVDGIPVLAIAVEPADDAAVFALVDHLEGTWLDGRGNRSIVMGIKLAQTLDLAIGDSITLSARDRNEAMNADEFTIIGLLNTPSPEVNKSGVYLAYADAEEFLALEGLRTELALSMTRRVNLKDGMADSDLLAAAIEEKWPQLEARSFGEIGRSFLQLSQTKGKSAGMMIAIILLIAGVGIANTILMSVYSRIREIGVLRAFGLKPKDISRLFLIEGGIIGFVGALAGLAFGIALVAANVYLGFPMEELMGNNDMGMPIMGTLYGEWNPSTMATAVIFGVIVALIAARSPAKKASRMEVTNALRFN